MVERENPDGERGHVDGKARLNAARRYRQARRITETIRGNDLSQFVNELEWSAERDRLIARMQLDRDVGLLSSFGNEAKPIEPDRDEAEKVDLEINDRSRRVKCCRGRLRDRRGNDAAHVEVSGSTCIGYKQTERIGLFDLSVPVKTRLDLCGQTFAQQFRRFTTGQRRRCLNDVGKIDTAEDFRAFEEIGRVELVGDNVAERRFDVANGLSRNRPHDA